MQPARFSASQLARSETADDIVAAMNIAFTGVISEIVDWTFKEGEAVLGSSS